MPDTSLPSALASEPVALSAEPFVVGAMFASVPFVATSGPSGNGGPESGALDAHLLSELHEAEQEMARAMAPGQRAAFAAGRRALRGAMLAVAPEHSDFPLLRTGRGAPQVPEGFSGSISHKRTRAIALVAPAIGEHVGVDLEERPAVSDALRPSLADRILTGAEREALRGLDRLAHREATLIRFALKEAVYKSIDPYVLRYVRFTEVELDVHPNGRATVRLTLPEPQIRTVRVDAHWRLEDRWIVAMAHSTPR